MCRNRPGPRCTDHSLQSMNRASSKLARIKEEAMKLIERFNTAKPGSKTAENLKARIEAKQDERRQAARKFEEEKLDYQATPGGQEELRAKISDEETDPEEAERLKVDLAAAEARRQWQNDMNKKICRAIQEGGVISAVLMVETERHLQHERLAEIQAKLIEAQKEKEHNEKEYKTPLGRQPSNAMRLRRNINRAQKTIYFFRKQELLISLMRGDLDSYLKRQMKRKTTNMSRKAFMGGVNVATKLIR